MVHKPARGDALVGSEIRYKKPSNSAPNLLNALTSVVAVMLYKESEISPRNVSDDF